MNNYLLKWVTAMQAISQNGLTYSKNEFDIERYHQLEIITKEMAAYFSGKEINTVDEYFSLEKGYATPKLEVRGFILKDNQLLLVRERCDNLWTLPGGWVDVNESPSESVIREVREESGFNVKVIRLLALWDKLKHGYSNRWPHAYTIFFLCEITSGEKQENIEISEIDFFFMDQLPDLSPPRISYNQLTRLHELALKAEMTSFD